MNYYYYGLTDENGRKFFKWVENTACFEQCFPFFKVFSKDSYCRQEKTRACLGKG